MMVVEDKIKARRNAIKLACLGFNMSHAITDHNSSKSFNMLFMLPTFSANNSGKSLDIVTDRF